MPFRKKYSCVLGSMQLCVRETDDPATFNVRVVRKPSDAFAQALLIRPGSVLTLRSGRSSARFVKVRVFKPRMQYNGHCVAGGELEIFTAGAPST